MVTKSPYQPPIFFMGADLVGVKVTGAPEQKFAFQLQLAMGIRKVETHAMHFIRLWYLFNIFFGLLGLFHPELYLALVQWLKHGDACTKKRTTM